MFRRQSYTSLRARDPQLFREWPVNGFTASPPSLFGLQSPELSLLLFCKPVCVRGGREEANFFTTKPVSCHTQTHPHTTFTPKANPPLTQQQHYFFLQYHGYYISVPQYYKASTSLTDMRSRSSVRNNTGLQIQVQKCLINTEVVAVIECFTLESHQHIPPSLVSSVVTGAQS